MKKYDVIVIGSGGGAKIVSPAARMGLKVAVLEREALGGTCLNRGCIPSKMMIHPADLIREIHDAKRFDIDVDTNFEIDFAKLITRISNTVDSDSQKISVGYHKHPNIDFYHSQGKFLSNYVIEINGEQITAEKIFIAVGVRPNVPNFPGLAGTPYMTSTEALRNTKLPRKLIVIGGGFIAVELGHAYGAFGCEVHVIARRRLLSFEDAQVQEEFTRVFSQHYQVYEHTAITQIEYANNKFSVSIKGKTGENKIAADALLIASGITPNTDSLGLENTSIAVNEKGYVLVDECLQTSVPGIYALGDCLGRYLFRHSVNFEGEYLMRTVFVEKKREAIRYPPMPHAVFSYPQIGSVGKMEEELQSEGVPYIVGLNPYAKSAMGMALLSDHGFAKILIHRETRKILGAHIVGREASNMIHMLIAFMNKDGTLDDLLNMIYIHPALPEIVRNAARKAQEEFDKT